MKTVRIRFDYLNGPLWKGRFDMKAGGLTTGVPAIDGDEELRALDREAGMLYESLYSFGSKGGGCAFDRDRFEEIKPSLLSLVRAILDRLADINDGTFVVLDEATGMLKQEPHREGFGHDTGGKGGVERKGACMVREKELTCQKALEDVLKAEFPQCEYSVGGYKEGAICLQREGGGWRVYNGYRNAQDNLSLHADIVDACLDMMGRLSAGDDRTFQRLEGSFFGVMGDGSSAVVDEATEC